ncbi:MAG: metallophosphoesterase [Alphaproteobacteria bacterium]|nr:metallophosphoesterase [Alphaproteobacteria bacterium]
MQQAEVFRIAQLTDVHLGPLPFFWPWHWNVKRALGFINFWTKRSSFNDPTLVRRLVDDLKRQTFDHIAVTGDLANLGMPAEFVQCRKWLEEVGPPDEVTAIPGNHDIYTPLRSDPGIERWRPYMQARDGADVVPGLPAPLFSGFPFVRTFGRFALINLNSAVCMPPAVAAGEVGQDQISRFAEMSRALHAAGFSRVVLIHHPPLPEHGPRGLRDAHAFEKALIDVGAELVLHGHNHRGMITWRDSVTGPVPIIGAGAAGEGVYNLYRLSRMPNGVVQIEVVVRVSSGMGKVFAERQRTTLDPAKEKRVRIV